MSSSHLIPWCPLLLLPLIFPIIRDFSSELSFHIRWPQYWRFSFSISPSSEYSRLITLKIDWFDLLAVQGTFKSLIQHPQFEGLNSLKFYLLYGPNIATILDHWKDHSLDYMDFCRQSNVSALQHTLCVCHCFPAKKQLSFDFMAHCSDFGAQKEKNGHYFHIFPFYLPLSNGARCRDLNF